MTPKEIHISVNQHLQELNSNVYGNVLAEEIDYFFNIEVLQYIRNLLNPKDNRTNIGFEHTKEKYTLLRQLYREVELPVFKHTGNFVYSLLPNDFYRLIVCGSNIVTFCNAPITSTDIVQTKYIAKITLKDIIDSVLTHGVDGEFFKGFKLVINANDSISGTPDYTFDLDDYYENGFEDEELKYILLHLLFEEINKTTNYKCYWNYYNNEFYDNTLIIESDNEFAVSAFYDEISSVSQNVEEEFLVEEVQFNKYNYTYSGDYNLVANRLILNESIITLNNSSFAKSIANSPTYKIQRDRLLVKLPENSMINSLVLVYIKKPMQLNLYLNRNTDIGNDVLDILARRTAEKISRIRGNYNTQLIERDNIFNE